MLRQLPHYLSVIAGSFAAFLVALLSILMTYIVAERMLYGTTPTWAEEVPRLLMVWVAFLGGVVCSRKNSHLSAGILPLLISKSHLLQRINILNHVILIVFHGILAYTGWQLAMITMDQELSAISLPAGIVYSALPVFSLASMFIHIFHISNKSPPLDGGTPCP